MIMKRARDRLSDRAGLDFVDQPTYKWLAGETINVDEYLQLDDIQLIYHFKRWSKAKTSILADYLRAS